MAEMTFVYLNVVGGVYTGAEYELYSGYWQAYLRKNGIKTKQYINTDPCTASELINDIARCSGEERIVFFVGEYNYYITKVIVNGLRHSFPNIELIAAGPVAEYISVHLRDDFPVDIFCTKSEFSQLLAVARMRSLSDHPELPSVHISADEIPHPYSSGVIPPAEIVNTGLLASRGCIAKCSFCSYGMERLVFSPESVAEELSYIYRNIGRQDITISFFDECFGISENNAVDVCNAISRKGLPYSLFCWCRLDMLSENLVEALAEAGFKTVLVGLESASERILGGLGKLSGGDSPAQFLKRLPEKIRLCNEHGITLMTSVNFGLEGEETADAAETLRYIEEHDLQNVSVNYTTIFPGSRLYARCVDSPERLSPSPTGLPLRTFYPKLNVGLISKSRAAIKSSKSLAFREEMMRIIAVDYYCNIKRHGEGLLKRNTTYIDASQLSSEESLLLSGSCLVIEVDDMSFGRYFCDGRKPLKYESDRYDSNLKFAYERNIYIENQLFIHRGDGQCSIIMNNIADLGRYRFRYFGSDLSAKTAFLRQELAMLKADCAELEYRQLPKLIFDDMGAFMPDVTGEPDVSEERYPAAQIAELRDAVECEPRLSAYASSIIFIYKNKSIFGWCDRINVYFSSRLIGIEPYVSQWTVLISCAAVNMLYDTRSKRAAVLKKGEKQFVLGDDTARSADFESMRQRLKKLMNIGEGK